MGLTYSKHGYYGVAFRAFFIFRSHFSFKKTATYLTTKRMEG
jgi:hypothetical protein